jgi:reverse gyrase
MGWYPQACPNCSGDLYDDPLEKGDVTCMMCARSFVASNVIAVVRQQRSQATARLEFPKAA